MILESIIREGVEVMRARGHVVSAITDAAFVDKDEDGDSKLDDNPDTGAGSEPGSVLMTVDGRTFTEEFFAGCTTEIHVVVRGEQSFRASALS